MNSKGISAISFTLLLFPLFFQSFLQACVSQRDKNPRTEIRALEILVETIQREKTAFTIKNLTEGEANWRWKVMDAESGKVVGRSADQDPVFRLPIGTYDILLTAEGQNTLTRHFRRMITVLPAIFDEKNADEIIDLSRIKEDNVLKDYKNQKRPGYRILIKGKYKGRLKITGLKGTRKHPVHIINKGQVEIEAANMTYPYAWLWGDNNQYILIDGKADPSIPYGFKLTGHAKKSGQILFLGGKFNRGFEICGFNIIGNQGVTNGAAAIQVQTSYSEDCNADNWTFEYLKVHNNKIEKASSEGMYLGYFTDQVRDTGYIPYRLGQVNVYRDTILNSGWDAIQIASADVFEVHDNYVDGASLSGKRSHSSFLSWNNGNKEGYCYRNSFRNCAHAATIIFGESGKEAYVYSNLFIEGTFPDNINTPGFFYTKAYNENEDVGLYIFHNTIVTSRISAKVDYRNTKENTGIPVIYAGNAILQDRLNLKRYPEIALGSNLRDSTYWIINNVWRMKEKENELQWSESYRPKKGSPLTKLDFDITKHISRLKGGFYDRDGYPLKHEEAGYTSGCFSAYQMAESSESNANGIH